MYVVQFGFLFTPISFRLFRLDDPLEFVPFVEGRKERFSNRSMNGDNLNLMSIIIYIIKSN